MTSLAEQLKRLALPQSDPSLLNRSEVASLLFSGKEAAGIDRDTFFAIGEFGRSDASGFKSRLSKKLLEKDRRERQTRVQKKAEKVVKEIAGWPASPQSMGKIGEQALLEPVSGHVKGEVIGKSRGPQGGQGLESLPRKRGLVRGMSLVSFSPEQRRL